MGVRGKCISSQFDFTVLEMDREMILLREDGKDGVAE